MCGMCWRAPGNTRVQQVVQVLCVSPNHLPDMWPEAVNGALPRQSVDGSIPPWCLLWHRLSRCWCTAGTLTHCASSHTACIYPPPPGVFHQVKPTHAYNSQILEWRGPEEQARQQELWRGIWAGVCAKLARCSCRQTVLCCPVFITTNACRRCAQSCFVTCGLAVTKAQGRSPAHGAAADKTACIGGQCARYSPQRPSFTTSRIASLLQDEQGCRRRESLMFGRLGCSGPHCTHCPGTLSGETQQEQQ